MDKTLIIIVPIVGILFLLMRFTNIGILRAKRIYPKFRTFGSRVFYTPKSINNTLLNLSDRGRQAYTRYLCLDYLLLLGILYIMNSINFISIFSNNYEKLLILSTAVAIFNIFENGWILVAIELWPKKARLTGLLACLSTLCKWLTFLVWIGFLVYSGIKNYI